MFHLQMPKHKSNLILQDIKDLFSSFVEDKNIGFYHLIDDSKYLKETYQVYEQFKNKKQVYHIGIGGSSLGPMMMISALNKSETSFTFINNIDGDEIHDQLQKINLDESVFYFVSKSGGTAETIAALAIITNILKSQFNISEENLHKYFIFCTDPQNGDLRSLGQTLNCATLTVPQNIGGRFSVLTHVGLLPALFAKIDINKLWQGANECQQWLRSSDQFFESARLICDLKQEGVNQTVFMPYSSKLKDFSSWFVQIWAESLGKKLDLFGNVVNTGLTPIPGYGATDQHSQMQLFMEGPYDKLIILIEIDKFTHDFDLSTSFVGSSFEGLNNQTLSQLYKAELHGTMKALEEEGRPFINLKIDQLNENSLGQLIMYCQCLTALTGKMLNIDPFNQPGVEAGKIYAYEFLKERI